MPPRLNLYGASQSLAIRSRHSIVSHQPRIVHVASRRDFTDEKDLKPPTSQNQDFLDHLSKETAGMGKFARETEPSLGQATRRQDTPKMEKQGQERASETTAKESADLTGPESASFANLLAMGSLENVAAGGSVLDALQDGHKFGLPTLPIPSNRNLKHRYDPVVDQVTKLLMRHGKLSVAQRNMSFILNHLRTAPPPTTNPARPLVPSAPPASHLPLNPILYLTVAIDSIAPLLRIRQQKGVAGGGASLPIPVPLRERQRRRQAVQWILDAADKKASRGSGRGQFAQRFAEEIISVVEGRSTIWDRRGLLHKTGTGARMNLYYGKRRRR